MCYGVLIGCIILMGGVFKIHCNSVSVDKKPNFSFVWLLNALLNYGYPSDRRVSFLTPLTGPHQFY